MTRYEKGFIEKCAEYGVDGKVVLEKMQKRAGLERALKAIGKFYRKPGKMVNKAIAGVTDTGKAGYYGSNAGKFVNESSELTRGGLRWDRILATLGLTGAAGAGAAAATGGGAAATTVSPAVKASLLAALGIGGAAAAGAAASSSDKKDDKKKKKKEDK